MPKRSSKRPGPKDINELAASIVSQATSENQPEPPEEEPTDDSGKNPAAVALGKLGGKKGGAARARKLSKKRRTEIAQRAASARWKKG